MEADIGVIPGVKVHSVPACRYTGALIWLGKDAMNEADPVELDTRGLVCPMPLLKAKRALNGMEAGQCLLVLSTDQGSVRDFRVFAEQSGHLLLTSDEADGVYRHLLKKN